MVRASCRWDREFNGEFGVKYHYNSKKSSESDVSRLDWMSEISLHKTKKKTNRFFHSTFRLTPAFQNNLHRRVPNSRPHTRNQWIDPSEYLPLCRSDGPLEGVTMRVGRWDCGQSTERCRGKKKVEQARTGTILCLLSVQARKGWWFKTPESGP